MKRIITLMLVVLGAIIVVFPSCNIANSASSRMNVEPQQVTPEGLSWYKIEDLEKMQIGDKKVMIDMYTSWCGWCKVMDKKTFTDPNVIQYLNDHFVMVKFNAEQREPVMFKGKTYEWINAGRRGVNKLAMELMNGRLGYPTMVYLDSDLNKIRSVPGYKTPQQLLSELKTL